MVTYHWLEVAHQRFHHSLQVLLTTVLTISFGSRLQQQRCLQGAGAGAWLCLPACLLACLVGRVGRLVESVGCRWPRETRLCDLKKSAALGYTTCGSSDKVQGHGCHRRRVESCHHHQSCRWCLSVMLVLSLTIYFPQPDRGQERQKDRMKEPKTSQQPYHTRDNFPPERILPNWERPRSHRDRHHAGLGETRMTHLSLGSLYRRHMHFLLTDYWTPLQTWQDYHRLAIPNKYNSLSLQTTRDLSTPAMLQQSITSHELGVYYYHIQIYNPPPPSPPPQGYQCHGHTPLVLPPNL